ncbi:SAM-dependent methyltransferase [Actinophytocola glycyrrhizae]|uniref:SAM-dependent methyltransferase n=1 Tax=Actinophytocola glycyrrhizae TaxID=2044873 RepID=A0ABV9RUV8_9PSEU
MSDFSREWLALREPADADARADDLLIPLRAHLGARDLVIRDLGSGTGSMARWLSPRLLTPHRWVLTDRDADLLAHAAVPGAVTEQRDLTSLTPEDLQGTSLVTGSALLDLLTEEEVTRLAEVCVKARSPALFVLSVAGKVDLEPPDPLDDAVTSAFNAHQRRTTGGRALLGPDAVPVMARVFEDLGATVHRCPSPWRLGPDRPELTTAWLQGWLGAACEQDEELAGVAGAYLRRRLSGPLHATVHHEDLLAIPG